MEIFTPYETVYEIDDLGPYLMIKHNAMIMMAWYLDEYNKTVH